MSSTALSAKTESVAAARGLAGVAAVAAQLAARVAEEDQLSAVIEAARAALHADECVLWAFSLGGLERVASSGHALARADEVSALLAAGDTERDKLVVRQLISEDQRLGAIRVR